MSREPNGGWRGCARLGLGAVPDNATLTLGAFEVTATVAVFEPDRGRGRSAPDLQFARGESAWPPCIRSPGRSGARTAPGRAAGVAPAIVTGSVPEFVTVDSWVGVAPSSMSFAPNGRLAGLRESSVWVPLPTARR